MNFQTLQARHRTLLDAQRAFDKAALEVEKQTKIAFKQAWDAAGFDRHRAGFYVFVKLEAASESWNPKIILFHVANCYVSNSYNWIAYDPKKDRWNEVQGPIDMTALLDFIKAYNKTHDIQIDIQQAP